MSAQPVDVLAVMDPNRYPLDTRQRERMCEARAAVAELIAERDRLQAKLDTNRCNRGHETLPLVLWDCPECHAETKRQLAELIAADRAYDEAAAYYDTPEGYTKDGNERLRAAKARRAAALARVQGGQS